ncbi:MAG: 3-hydroxyacyl-ACP dehydratase FabZ family protein [Gemmataceae bacterium]
MRWIWIDNFLDFESKKSARAVKNLTLAEDHYAEHFPGFPVMPATLMLEGLAQTGGILVGEANDFREKVVLAKINSARFHREAIAGERLIYEVELLVLRDEGASVRGVVKVEHPGANGDSGNIGTESIRAETIGEAEIFFAHLDQSMSQEVFGDKNFVFTGELKNLLGLARLQAEKSRPVDSPDDQGTTQ